MIRRPVKTRLNPRRPDPSQPRNPTHVTAVATISSTNVLLTFAVPISLNGIPQFTVQGVLPVAATRPTATTVLLDYTASVVATNVLIIPDLDPAIRTAQGGYVNPLTYTFP